MNPAPTSSPRSNTDSSEKNSSGTIQLSGWFRRDLSTGQDKTVNGQRLSGRRAVDTLLAPFLRSSESSQNRTEDVGGYNHPSSSSPTTTTTTTLKGLPEQVGRWRSSAAATATRAGEVVGEWKAQTSDWFSQTWQTEDDNGESASKDQSNKRSSYHLLPLPTDQINSYRTPKSASSATANSHPAGTDEDNDDDNNDNNNGTLQDWLRSQVMGCFTSKPAVLEVCDGNDVDYNKRYVESKALGEGEFAVVKLAHDTHSSSDKQVAVKKLRKGMQFKDNVLYSAIKPEALREECDILRALSNDEQHFVLQLLGIYESSSCIWIVTEFCEGGEMMPWVSKNVTHMTTHLVSRISFQLLTALRHCASHNVLHRDIKPQNVMFVSNTMNSDLRLIDFGFGCIDPPQSAPDAEITYHATFAGTAFYIAPEVFQKKYTSKLDVWSVGVTLYVLVAGYPANELQKAFNILQKRKRDLRTLPNVPMEKNGDGGLPDSYWDMLDLLLTYSAKKRPTAAQVLETCEFLEEAGRTSSSRTPTLKSATSTRIVGSVGRHTAYLEYGKFELAVTTLLASFLSRDQLKRLLEALDEQLWLSSQVPHEEDEEEDYDDSHRMDVVPEGAASSTPHQSAVRRTHLQIISIRELQALVQELGFNEAAKKITEMKNYQSYDGYAYHVNLLRQFATTGNSRGDGGSSSAGSAISGGSVRSSERSRRRLSRTLSSGSRGLGSRWMDGSNSGSLSSSSRKLKRTVSLREPPAIRPSTGSRKGGR